MAKIVIIAPAGTDVDDAVKLLKNAGNEVEVEEPTPKSLLHIVLGLLGPSAYGFGPGYAFSPGDQADDSVDDAEADLALDAPEGDAAAAETDLDGADDVDIPSADDDFSFEGLTAIVDGEKVMVERVDAPTSTLVVEKLSDGPRAEYMINESQFAFWPTNASAPATLIQVQHGTQSVVHETYIAKGERTVLQVGDDLASIFEPTKPVE
jgi:hypothetical protein